MDKEKNEQLEQEHREFFQSFYEDNIRLIYSIARKYASDTGDCEDLVQETVIRLMRNITTLNPIDQSKIGKYIDLTVRSVFIDRERRRRKEKVVYLEDHILEDVPAEEYPERDMEHKISAYMEIERLKKELPDRDWILLEGKYVLGLSQEELSGLAGVSVDSVRMLLHRARVKAREILGEMPNKP